MRYELEDLPPKLRAQAEAQIRKNTGRRDDPYGEPPCNGYKPMPPEAPIEPPARAPKYKNSKAWRTLPSGGRLRFDSQKEARRYDELALMLAAGAIRDLKLQPEFTLQEAYTAPDGVRVRAIRYQADFMYQRPTEPDKYGTVYWIDVVEDVKSPATKTRVYEIKKKLMRERLGVSITEV